MVMDINIGFSMLFKKNQPTTEQPPKLGSVQRGVGRAGAESHGYCLHVWGGTVHGRQCLALGCSFFLLVGWGGVGIYFPAHANSFVV